MRQFPFFFPFIIRLFCVFLYFCLLMIYFFFCQRLCASFSSFSTISTSLTKEKKEEECPDADRKSFKHARVCVCAIRQHAHNHGIFLFISVVVNSNICRSLIDLLHINLFFIGVLFLLLRITEFSMFFFQRSTDCSRCCNKSIIHD